jgi:hypothetical protein
MFTALSLIVALGAFAVFLVLNAGTKDATEWERWVYVFGAVEAPAFTAIGWLFGREVNRQRAEAAEQRAEKAETQKTEARTDGATLAGLVVGGHGGAPSARPRLEQQGVGSQVGLDAAVDFARRTYDL